MRDPKLTPSFVAKLSRLSFIFMRYFVSNSASDWGLFLQGGESTLMALITRWQKGFKNDPFRHLIFNNIDNGLVGFSFLCRVQRRMKFRINNPVVMARIPHGLGAVNNRS
jgi:hypothetical protein